MKLISLKIQNFRVIKTAYIVFPDKVIGIVGPNGSGKSSIVEAISFALYGNQVIRSGKDEVKSSFAKPDENCEVSLEFLINDDEYKVTRRLVGKSSRAEVELYRKGSSESVGVNETKSYVGQLLGLDWRGFLSSFLARQSELNSLSDLQPSRRQDHIAGMLGIERLDRAIKKAKDDIKLNRDKANFLEKDISDKDAVESRIDELYESITKLKPVLNSKKEDYKNINETHKTIVENYKSMSSERDKFVSLNANLTARMKTLENLNEQNNQLLEEQEHLGKLNSKAEILKETLKNYPQIKNQLSELVEIKNQTVLKKQLISQKKSIDDEYETVEKKKIIAEKNILELENSLKEYPENTDSLFETEKISLEDTRSRYTQLNTELSSIKSDKDKLSKQLNSISELGPESVCDHCLRPLGEDYNSIREHFNLELAKIENNIQEKDKALKEVKKEGEKLRDSVKKLEKDSKQIYQYNVDLKSFNNELKNLSEQSSQNRKKYSDIDKELSQYDNISFDQKLFDELQKTDAELSEKQKEYDNLSGQLSRVETLKQQLASLDEKIKALEKDISKSKDDLDRIGFDEKKYNELTEQFNSSQNNLDTAKNELVAIEKEFELTQKEHELKLEQKVAFEKKMAELEDIRTSHYYGEKLTNLFGEFRKELIASIRPRLADISSRLFNDMTDNRYNLVELDEKYNLRVMDDGQFYGVDRFSGGEKDLANLCLRLAISVTLTESAGLNRSFVILDEVFGSQDNERKNLILNGVAKLKDRFPQILLITHIDDIKDGVEQIIDVKPTGLGWSEVVVNENF